MDWTEINNFNFQNLVIVYFSDINIIQYLDYDNPEKN